MIRILRDGSFRRDLSLRAQLLDIVRPSYVDPAPILTRELAECDTLYLRLHEGDRVAAFFLVGWSRTRVSGVDQMFAYLGLSATHQDFKNTAVVRDLYRCCSN